VPYRQYAAVLGLMIFGIVFNHFLACRRQRRWQESQDERHRITNLYSVHISEQLKVIAEHLRDLSGWPCKRP
jgi:hypothetical protein